MVVVSRRSPGATRRARGRERRRVAGERCEHGPLGVLERFTRNRAEAVRLLRRWIRGLSRRVGEERPVGALDYIVLLAVVRRDPLVDCPELEADRQRAAGLLVVLRERLLGQRVPIDTVRDLRLPRWFVARQTCDWVHPYLHMRRQAALDAAGPWMRMFLRSRYASHIARAHYLHHRDASVNQNLAIGADFVLGYRMSSMESVLRLRAMGAL